MSLNIRNNNEAVARANQALAERQSLTAVAKSSINERLCNSDIRLQGLVIRFREALRTLEYGSGPTPERPDEPDAASALPHGSCAISRAAEKPPME